MSQNGTEIHNYDLKVVQDDEKIVITQTVYKNVKTLGDGFKKTDKKGSKTDYLLNGVPRYKDDKNEWKDGKVFHKDEKNDKIVYSFKPCKVTKTVYD